jgi:hypothetical protein
MLFVSYFILFNLYCFLISVLTFIKLIYFVDKKEYSVACLLYSVLISWQSPAHDSPHWVLLSLSFLRPSPPTTSPSILITSQNQAAELALSCEKQQNLPIFNPFREFLGKFFFVLELFINCHINSANCCNLARTLQDLPTSHSIPPRQVQLAGPLPPFLSSPHSLFHLLSLSRRTARQGRVDARRLRAVRRTRERVAERGRRRRCRRNACALSVRARAQPVGLLLHYCRRGRRERKRK